MYKASDIEKQYGFNPMEFDLSRIPKWEDFVKAMNYACMKQFAALEKGGRMAVLMGDIKRKGKLYSMVSEIAKPGTLEQIIIKTQHNCVSDRRSYGGRFMPIVHEYIMVVRKDDSLVFPVMLTKAHKIDIRDMHGATWRDVVAAVMGKNSGAWKLEDIYRELEDHKKAKNNNNWQAKVRQTLQYHPQIFRHEGRGMWSLASCAG